MKFDFSGYATKNDLKCADGRVIRHGAFKENDGTTVPLVWQHQHNDPANVLGHAILETRSDGVYTYCKFNDTPAGENAKLLVKHGDITSLSIFANKLVQKGSNVIHGAIREVSLVLSGANPGALIDNLNFAHGDGTVTELDDEAIIYTGLELSHSDVDPDEDEEDQNGSKKKKEDGKTVRDVFDSMTEEQKNVVYAMLAEAIGGEDEDEDEDEDEENLEHSNYEGGNNMKKNIFDNQEDVYEADLLNHSQIGAIFKDAQRFGSLKESVLAHADDYGIDDIDILFPNAHNVMNTPEFVARRMEWVTTVLNNTKKSPFSRIRTVTADITPDEARAKGYVKAARKTEEVFGVMSRSTSPTTIYKKQKLDRDDVIDITDMDVVSWLKAEMRIMLDEEVARAILIGDGREVSSPDKIKEDHIRPIYKDDEFYAHKVQIAADADVEATIEAIIRSRKHYKGSGTPVLYTTTDNLTNMILHKDKMGRRMYATQDELASTLRVSKIIEVPVMDGTMRTDDDDTTILELVGIIVNLADYTIGADKGGQVSMFDDFDIDFNQHKYLLETRMSGCLIHHKSAIVIEKVTE